MFRAKAGQCNPNIPLNPGMVGAIVSLYLKNWNRHASRLIMDKLDRRSATPQLYSKAWLEQARAQLADSGRAAPKKQAPRPAIWLIVGLVFLQAVTLAAAFTVAVSGRPVTPNSVDALDVSSAVEQPLFFTDPPPPPSPTPPPPDIFERHSAPPVAAPVLAPDAAVTLRGVEITQGIQVFQEPQDPRCHPDYNHPNNIFCNNSIPLVAGRHTLLRVYLACNGTCPATETTVRLRALKGGREYASLARSLPVETLQRVSHLSAIDLRLNLGNSVNFEFFPPPDWMLGQITFELTAAPQNQSQRPPAVASLAANFATRKPLRVAYLPIEYAGLRPPDPIDVDYWLLRMYPVPGVEYYRLPMPDLEWQGDVGKSELLRKLLYTYWFYAQYHPTEARPDQLFGWLPQELYNGGASDPFWCPNCAGPHSSRVAFGGLRPEQDIGGPRILAHEIAHNLGAQHAWSPTQQEDAGCFRAAGVDIQVDPQWPYAQTPHIQEVGIDLYSNPPIIHPPLVYDMMAYCTQPWISPHTYRKIFDSPFLQPNAADLLTYPDFTPRVEATGNGTLLVSGVVYPDGTVSKPEVIRLEGAAFGDSFTPPLEFKPPAGDDYCLKVQAAGDSLLAEHCFDVGFVDLETGQPTEPSPYFFTLPEVDADKVEKISLTRNRVAVVIVTPSNNPPQVSVIYPNGGEVLDGAQTITWNAHDEDGDSLLFDLLYSVDGGQSWLPLAVRLADTGYTFHTGQLLPGQNALIRVIAGDGFNTAVDESDAPFTIQGPPPNSISLIGPAAVTSGQTFEISVVANNVAEPGLFGVQFELAFDPGQVQMQAVHPHSALELVVDDTIDNDAGRVTFIASRKGRVDNLTGQITLATLTLTATGQGQVNFDLYDVAAGARGGIPVTISQVRGLSLQVVE